MMNPLSLFPHLNNFFFLFYCKTRSDDAGISEEELTMMSPADLVTILTKTEKDEIAQVTKKPIGQRKKLKVITLCLSINRFLGYEINSLIM